MGELRKVAPEPGAYVSESNFFQADWQHAYWGANYERLRAMGIKMILSGEVKDGFQLLEA